MKAAIIGSGMAGLTSAALLAQAGAEVEVFEQNENIGGVTAFARKKRLCLGTGAAAARGIPAGRACVRTIENPGDNASDRKGRPRHRDAGLYDVASQRIRRALLAP